MSTMSKSQAANTKSGHHQKQVGENCPGCSISKGSLWTHEAIFAFLTKVAVLVLVLNNAERGLQAASLAPTSHPVCVWAAELAKRQLSSGRFELPPSAMGDVGEVAAGHTAVLVLLGLERSCEGVNATDTAARWLRWAIAHGSDTTSKTLGLAGPPWGEAARRLRLLGALPRVPAGMKSELNLYAQDALQTLEGWRDTDGLWWSDLARQRKGLLENIEVYLAFRSGAVFFRKCAENDYSRRCQHHAEVLHGAIENLLWVNDHGRYAWQKDTSGTLHTALERWAPDVKSELAAVGYLPTNSSLRALFDELLAAAENRSWDLNLPKDVEALAYYALAAREAGSGEKYREFKQLLAQIPASMGDKLPLDVWLLIAQLVSPR